ncbi:MAG: hypothetical protein KBD78_08320 [Oligoflexales bacterium]|nr:hypothetical protein [Oligoflexales bacterium]
MVHLFSVIRSNQNSDSFLISCSRILIVFLCILILAAVSAAADSNAAERQDALLAECKGCHATTRNIPNNGFFKISLGKWTDQQCYGCHAEINDVALKRAAGENDPRYFAIPLDETKLHSLVKSPLSYMWAPVLPAADNSDSQYAKYSTRSLLLYLRRPFNVRGALTARPPQMPAFTTASDAELVSVMKGLGLSLSNEGGATSIQSSIGESIWVKHCSNCHSHPASEVMPNRRGLSLFSERWLFAYANGKVASQQRTMPVVILSAAEAQHLSFYLKSELMQDYEQLDRQYRNVNVRKQTALAETIDGGFVQYLFNGFFKDGDCVHCHSGQNRMRAKFEASAIGLEIYTRQGKVSELVERLKNRALEVKYGIGGRLPGMPQSNDAINPNIIDKIELWRWSGCPDQAGQKLCPSS